MLMKVEGLKPGMMFDAMPAVIAGGYDSKYEEEAGIIEAAECLFFECECVDMSMNDGSVLIWAHPHNVLTKIGVEVDVMEGEPWDV